jgi:hypothetical protein
MMRQPEPRHEADSTVTDITRVPTGRSTERTEAGEYILREQVKVQIPIYLNLAQDAPRRRLTMHASSYPALDSALIAIAAKHPDALADAFYYVLGNRTDSFEQKAAKLEDFMRRQKNHSRVM